MRLETLLLVTLIGLAPARAAEVIPLPPHPIEILRGRLQAVLRGDRRQAPLRSARTLGLNRTRAGLVALEEAVKAVGTTCDPFAADRITRVLKYAARSLEFAELTPNEFEAMHGYLGVLLNVLTNPRPAVVVRMLYHHRMWSADHLDYLVAQAGAWPGRPHTYRALRKLRSHLSERQLVTLRRQLRQADRASDALAMLEEFGGLAPRRYAHLIHRLAHELTSGARNDRRYRARAVEIEMRALGRMQQRILAGDAAILAAVRAAERMGGGDGAREVLARVRTGRLDIDLSDRNLSSADPLKVAARSAANVVDFAECARRFGR